MRNIRIFGAICALAVAIIMAFKVDDKIATKNSSNSFAVVELFTSEGCSSCPAADAVVAKIQEEHDQQVYILAYHVDYWNRLGWTDVFSKHEYSERQRRYADQIAGAEVYTPQAVVNGKQEFVGSKEGTLRNSIAASLKQQHDTQLIISDVRVDRNAAMFSYAINSEVKNAELVFALVQKNAVTKVKKGENSGRTLAHVQIVRALQTIPFIKHTGTASINLPAGFDAAGYELIGLLQNSKNGGIDAAARSGFTAENKVR